MTKLPRGSIVALITPFHEDGTVNFAKLGELIEWHIAQGTDGILVLGTTGESSTMSHQEDDAVVAFAVDKVAGRVPVIAGTGSNDTQTQLEKSIRAQRMGADALLLIAPYYNKANPEGLIRHFTKTADAVSIPIILYNIPGRTGMSIPESVVEKLAKHPNIQGIKEASGNLSYAMNISHLLSDDFVMYSGNDDIVVPMLAAGASGVISVVADVMPKQTHEMVQAWFDGDPKRALQLQNDMLDLIHKLFIEVNPIPVKEALNLMGKEVGGYRLPLYPMADENRAKLKESMEKAGLL